LTPAIPIHGIAAKISLSSQSADSSFIEYGNADSGKVEPAFAANDRNRGPRMEIFPKK
jgi:hypothetical protein